MDERADARDQESIVLLQIVEDESERDVEKRRED